MAQRGSLVHFESLPANPTSPVAPTPLGLQGTHHRTCPPPTTLHIGARWRDVQGANDWKGLMEPHKLDECLRAELIRYGQFAEVAYDAFDFDKFSQYCGSCRYSKEKLFKEVDLHNTGYKVHMYIYATADVEVPYLLRKSERADAWSSKSNWIGYVAVCTDEKEIQRLGRRDILIVWRGTVTGLEWAANLTYHLIPCKLTDEMKHGESTHIKVEAGFQSLYTSDKDDSRFNKISAQSYLTKGIQDLIDKYKDDGHELSITVTGHSLGSALATLSAYDLAEAELNHVEIGGKNVTIPITVFSFAGPRVGNGHFKDRVEELGIKVLRVENKGDIVPHVPGFRFLERLHGAYQHVGVVLHVDDKESHHLDQSKASFLNMENLEDLITKGDVSPLSVQHNLEVYLHLIDGYGRYDVWPPSRDPVLVNKFCGFLKNDKFVPESWWQLKHKGLEYSILENRYYQPDRAIEDIPVPPMPKMVAEAQALKKSLTFKRTRHEEEKLEEKKLEEKKLEEKPEPQKKSEEKNQPKKISEEKLQPQKKPDEKPLSQKKPEGKHHVSLKDLLHEEN
ncbi:hypothetical protein M758_8G066600 [Ceratodon purpureus]|nr:hypothetical protein M758_8G066600 [Ceratodon purpureus]